MVVGLLTIPGLVHALGEERFGILTLTWAVMGYFSLFELGLGRALTQIVADRSGVGDCEELPNIMYTGLVMMFLLGVVGGGCLGVASPWVVGRVLKMSPVLHRETLYAFILMSFSVPSITVLAGLRGILEARQRFIEINILRFCMGVMTFLGPWLVSFKTVHLFWIVLSMVVMRYAAIAGHYWVCRKKIPELKDPGTFQFQHWTVLLRFGGWMTVSNLISPLMVNLDRFFIGGFLSMSAIAYYATPFDMITKALVVPGSIASVLFPMFGTFHRTDPEGTKKLYNKGLRTIFLILTPVLLGLALSAPWILLHWLGANFAYYGGSVMRILCLGVLINGLATVPFAYIQGVARPDLTAKFHLAEAPIYLLVLWVLGSLFGIVGVAWAWVMRVSLDLALLLLASRHLQSIHSHSNLVSHAQDEAQCR